MAERRDGRVKKGCKALGSVAESLEGGFPGATDDGLKGKRWLSVQNATERARTEATGVGNGKAGAAPSGWRQEGRRPPLGAGEASEGDSVSSPSEGI